MKIKILVTKYKTKNNNFINGIHRVSILRIKSSDLNLSIKIYFVYLVFVWLDTDEKMIFYYHFK